MRRKKSEGERNERSCPTTTRMRSVSSASLSLSPPLSLSLSLSIFISISRDASASAARVRGIRRDSRVSNAARTLIRAIDLARGSRFSATPRTISLGRLCLAVSCRLSMTMHE